MTNTVQVDTENGRITVEDDGPSQGDVFASLSDGDLIQFDGRGSTKNPHKVVGDGPSYINGNPDDGGILSVEGPGGASKLLTQNKHDPDRIAIMSMGNSRDSGTWIKNLRVVG